MTSNDADDWGPAPSQVGTSAAMLGGFLLACFAALLGVSLWAGHRDLARRIDHLETCASAPDNEGEMLDLHNKVKRGGE